MKILELYSGIGGMHTAFKMTHIPGEVVLAVDINQVANEVYSYNYPDTMLINGNIQGLSPKIIRNLNIDTILMSPPCQPFTRNGLQRDDLDPRSNSFIYVLNMLPALYVQNILIENVKGFEKSEMHKKLIAALVKNGFYYKEFLLSPKQFGVPNSRMRYYCVAKKDPFNEDQLLQLPQCGSECCYKTEPYPVDKILEKNRTDLETYKVPIRELVRRCRLLDIVYHGSRRSCCFTKSYGRYIEGTGSVFCPSKRKEVAEVYRHIIELDEIEDDDDMKLTMKKDLLRSLNFRFFTPREILRLMNFPEEFSFPSEVTVKQSYKLLGNSINCLVVSQLIMFALQ